MYNATSTHRATGTVGNLSRETGSALLITVLAMLIIVGVGFSASRMASTEVEISANYQQSWGAFYAADGAAQASFGELIALSRQLGRFADQSELDTITVPSIQGATLPAHSLVPLADAVESPLTTGYYQGLLALTRPYEVAVTAETTGYPRVAAEVTMGMFFDIIPIFQFAVFYEDDLELLPGPAMTLSGRVHSNSDIYFGANNSLTINSSVTSAGDVFHRRKDQNVVPGGAVRIRDGLDSFPAMGTLDSSDADWEEAALTRWRGNVRSSDHGISRLNLSVSDQSNPHIIIEPGYDSDTAAERTSKLFYSAEMSINVLNGQGFDTDGSSIDLGSAIGFDLLFDQREQKHMLVVEIDVSSLPTIQGFPAAGVPAVVYIGSFEPGNGIPPWEIVIEGADDAVTDFDDWLLETFPGGTLPSRISQVQGEVNAAWNFCLDSNAGAAEGQINAALTSLENAANGGDISQADADYLDAVLQPLANCETGSTADWPSEWSGYLPPYDGGNTEFAVKIQSGSELLQPLTFVTALPAYLKGDYNSVNKKPAAVIADAITILSNAWGDDDLPYSLQSKSNRIAANTRQNVALMLGNTETTFGSYNGGVENLPRFLEKWSSRTFTFRGSLIDLWYSRNATGAWGSSNVYSPPSRDWEFDTDLLEPGGMPPGTPKVYTVRMLSWTRS